MADVHEPEIRSYNMSRIRSKNTSPEMIVRRFLHKHGFRYALHAKSLPGKPDLVFKPFKTVIFVHGCFWHGHEACRYFVIPKTRTAWWTSKIERNKSNDFAHAQALKKLGWRLITIYECDLKPVMREKSLQSLLRKMNMLRSSQRNTASKTN